MRSCRTCLRCSDFAPVFVKDFPGRSVLCVPPLLGALLFENEDSDARDHCAAERTFLSWLRLSVYMAVVAVAVILTFHLKSQPTDLERRLALPFGIIFWLLAVLCLGTALGNYIKTVQSYSKKRAIVQSGPKTQVSFVVVALSIIVACILFLVLEAGKKSKS